MATRARRVLVRLVAALAALAALGGAAWWFAPSLASAALARVLPLRCGAVVLERVVADVEAAHPAQVVVTATPWRARDLIAAATGRSIPPGLIASGLTIDGRLELPAFGDPPLSLRLRADDALPSPPLVEARLPTAATNAALAQLCAQAYAAGELPVAAAPSIDPGATLEDASDAADKDGAIVRRFRFVGSGAIAIGAEVVRVRSCSALLVFTCETASRGYSVAPSVAIERLDLVMPRAWSSLRPSAKLVETMINARLRERPPLAGVLLPVWTPFDTRVRAMLEGAPAPMARVDEAQPVY